MPFNPWGYGNLIRSAKSTQGLRELVEFSDLGEEFVEDSFDLLAFGWVKAVEGFGHEVAADIEEGEGAFGCFDEARGVFADLVGAVPGLDECLEAGAIGFVVICGGLIGLGE